MRALGFILFGAVALGGCGSGAHGDLGGSGGSGGDGSGGSGGAGECDARHFVSSEPVAPGTFEQLLEPGPPVVVGTTCTVTPLLLLADIPDDPSLDDDDPDTVAIFEVAGHALIGKHLDDADAAENGLLLWQEITTRIPENQLLDLVQFEISQESDPVAYFNRLGDVTTDRYGLKLGFSVESFTRNQADPCAPLAGHRGSFDWSLVHELGHLRGWLDGSWFRFLDEFTHVPGDGEGYPADGSPVLDGDYVTSYAERADGDEDYAECWTTLVMLDDDAIPDPAPGEPLAVTKVRWVSEQPGLQELRAALRVSEAGGGGVTVDPAPRLFAALPVDLSVPAWLAGSFRGEVETDTAGVVHEQRFDFSADDVVETHFEDGVQVARRSLKELYEGGRLVRLERTSDVADDEFYSYNGSIFPSGGCVLEDSFRLSQDFDGLLWSRLNGPIDAQLMRLP